MFALCPLQGVKSYGKWDLSQKMNVFLKIFPLYASGNIRDWIFKYYCKLFRKLGKKERRKAERKTTCKDIIMSLTSMELIQATNQDGMMKVKPSKHDRAPIGMTVLKSSWTQI